MSTRQTAFWCARVERDVEVTFETRGIPGLWRPRGVVSCTAFDAPTAVVCGRRCLDTAFRRQWPPALPVRSRRDTRARSEAETVLVGRERQEAL